MTRPTGAPRLPGSTLLTIARLFLNDELVSTVVQPTIADLQSEVVGAGPNRLRRLRARCRGYFAFWTVMLAAPFAASTTRTAVTVASPLAEGRLAVASTLIILLAVVVPMLGVWAAVVAAAGALVAIVIHRWNERHPSDLPSPDDPPWRSPQINFSSTDVAGNIGGLIFVLGSVLIVSIGLPSVFWFLIAGTAAACLLAWGLVAWHARHPKWGSPQNRIVWRESHKA